MIVFKCCCCFFDAFPLALRFGKSIPFCCTPLNNRKNIEQQKAIGNECFFPFSQSFIHPFTYHQRQSIKHLNLTLALAWLAPLNVIFHLSIVIHPSLCPSIHSFIHSIPHSNLFHQIICLFTFSLLHHFPLLFIVLDSFLPTRFTIFWHHPKTGGNKMSIILLPAPFVVG